MLQDVKNMLVGRNNYEFYIIRFWFRCFIGRYIFIRIKKKNMHQAAFLGSVKPRNTPTDAVVKNIDKEIASVMYIDLWRALASQLYTERMYLAYPDEILKTKCLHCYINVF